MFLQLFSLSINVAVRKCNVMLSELYFLDRKKYWLGLWRLSSRQLLSIQQVIRKKRNLEKRKPFCKLNKWKKNRNPALKPTGTSSKNERKRTVGNIKFGKQHSMWDSVKGEESARITAILLLSIFLRIPYITLKRPVVALHIRRTISRLIFGMKVKRLNLLWWTSAPLLALSHKSSKIQATFRPSIRSVLIMKATIQPPTKKKMQSFVKNEAERFTAVNEEGTGHLSTTKPRWLNSFQMMF